MVWVPACAGMTVFNVAVIFSYVAALTFLASAGFIEGP
jgi:hypothetical protein